MTPTTIAGLPYNEYIRRWKNDHPERWAEIQKAAKDKCRRRHTARLMEARAGGCVDCGATERLHFHHLNPSTKSAEVSALRWRTDEVFWAEVAKCVVLCEPCHMERHRIMAAEIAP